MHESRKAFDVERLDVSDFHAQELETLDREAREILRELVEDYDRAPMQIADLRESAADADDRITCRAIEWLEQRGADPQLVYDRLRRDERGDDGEAADPEDLEAGRGDLGDVDVGDSIEDDDE